MMSILNISKRSIGVMTLFFISILCFGTVSAVMISSPDVVKPGEQVSVYVGKIKAADTVRILVSGNIKTDAGSFFNFGLHNLQLGLALSDPQLHVNMNGLVPNSKVNLTINHLEGGEIVYPPESVDANGVTDFTQNDEQGLPKGTYYIDINGTAGSTQIPVTFEIKGDNSNTENLIECTFNIVGFSNGVFDVTTYVNTEIVEKKSFTVQDQLIAIK